MAKTVERLRELVPVVEPPTEASLSVVCSPAQLGVVVVTGPRAVGSSTVGFGLATVRWRADLRTGFVDLQQLAFLACPESAEITNAALATTQLATTHAFLASRGAGLLVVSGHLGAADRGTLKAALPNAPVTVVRLRAEVTTLEAHVRDRVSGSEARLAGDDLLGDGPGYQAAVVAAASPSSSVLTRTPVTTPSSTSQAAPPPMSSPTSSASSRRRPCSSAGTRPGGRISATHPRPRAGER